MSSTPSMQDKHHQQQQQYGHALPLPQPTAGYSKNNTSSGGKKSHACGPCRRLKRKCDLQIPCGTCKSGRNTRVDECLENPARPLNNIQELIAPNSKFGRVHRNSSINSPSSSEDSPNAQKKQKTERTSSFGQFEMKTDEPHQTSNFSASPLSQGNVQQGIASLREHVLPNHQPPSSSGSSTNNGYATQTVQTGLPQLGSLPIQQHQSPTWRTPTHQPNNTNSHNNNAPMFQQLQQQIHQTYPTQRPSASYAPSPTSTGPGMTPITATTSVPSAPALQSDMNYSLHQQLQSQFQRIQVLESQNAESRATINTLQNELNTRSVSSVSSHQSEKTKNEYKWKYIKLLPSKIQTKLLVEFYLQNIDYIYHPVHHPSFRNTLEEFWKDEQSVDVGWLATLFMVLGLAAIHLPKGLINIDPTEIERSHNIWFDASKECINIADSMRKTSSQFSLYILQWFSLCQLYFYATRRAEQLNEILDRSIKYAHAMGLDKDDEHNPNLLEVELKRRLWWDICGCDTFRCLSLGVRPKIRSYNSKVPFPSNANDVDITTESVKVCSMSVPTDNSFNVYRAVMMKIMNGIFEKDHAFHARDIERLDELKDQVFKGLIEVDMELCQTNKSWFFELDKEGAIPYVVDPKIHFQHHMLHTCICIHRFRIYQNYLQEGIPVAWEVARSTARALFQVYRKLRDIYDLKNPLFLPQIHQSFTGSVIQSMMLMLNKMSLSDQTALYEDIDLMLNDLEQLGKDVFILKPEILKESFKVLDVLKKNINKNLVELEKDQKDIVSNVFGGKDMTESYLKKCTVSFIIENEKERQQQPVEEPAVYDYANQLGTLIDDNLIDKTVSKFKELEQRLKPGETILDRRGSMLRPPNTPLFGPQNGTSKVNNGNGAPLLLEHHRDFHNANGVTQDEYIDRNARHATPFELNFNDIDTFWSDMGQQGLDELNHMYYNEFSGYKIG